MNRMFLVRTTCLIVASAILVAGCGRNPTGPTAVVPAVTVGVVPQTSTPLPPRDSIVPPRALGITRFVAFGDSITWGASSAWDPRFFFADIFGGYLDRLHMALSTYHSPQVFTLFNEGLPGEWASSSATLTRFRRTLTDRRPGAVLLLEGINDLSNDVPPQQVAAGLQRMLDAAAQAGVPVLIATMYQTYETTDPDGNPRPNGAAAVPALNREIRRIAAGRLNVYLVDLEPVMRDRRLVGADGVHLESSGFEVMATAFLSAIEAAFPVRGSFQ
jgi:lysophospholipase L1-like esterase